MKPVATTSSASTCSPAGTPKRGSSHFRTKRAAKVIASRDHQGSGEPSQAGPAVSFATSFGSLAIAGSWLHRDGREPGLRSPFDLDVLEEHRIGPHPQAGGPVQR